MSSGDDFWLELADPGSVALWDPPFDGPTLREVALAANDPDAPLPVPKQVSDDQLNWAPGALAGVLGHHVGPSDEAQAPFVALIEAIHRTATRTLDRQMLLDAYEALDSVELATPRDVANAVAAHDLDMSDDDHRRRFTEAAALVSGWLVCRSRHRGPAKAGLAAAALLDWHPILRPAAELGRLTEFTAEVCTLLRAHGTLAEGILLDLARWHTGWGRVHAVEALVALEHRLPDVDRWLVEEGWSNTVSDGYTAPLVAERVDVLEWMWSFDEQGELMRSGLDGARGIANALLDAYSPGATIEHFPVMGEVLDKWFLGLSMLRPDAVTLEDLGFAHTLWKALEDPESPAYGAFDASRSADLAGRCRKLLSEEASRAVVDRALRHPDTSFITAITLAPLYGIDPLPLLIARLEADPDDSVSWFYLCRDHGSRAGAQILSLALRVLPADLVSTTARMPMPGSGPGVHIAVMHLWSNVCRRDPVLGPRLVAALLDSTAPQAREHGERLREQLSAEQRERLGEITGPRYEPTSEQAMDATANDPEATATEEVVARVPDILCWKGAQMGMTVLSSKPGELLLTSQRLVFRSYSGKRDLDVPRSSIISCEAGKKRALVVRFREQDGSEAAFTFGQQLGMPNLAAWVQALQPRST
ncbi:hypothetical protein ACFQU3_11360 [Terrabacter sp. GCM10028922]|uniref:hypothetical protein n=1 Tax=Terrabacter sp. GCM10028922 TaxID=3273428 RepID=UPI003607FD65